MEDRDSLATYQPEKIFNLRRPTSEIRRVLLAEGYQTRPRMLRVYENLIRRSG
jgi:hypothetical protein